MYERFTDRARKVLQLANQEAQRLNSGYIGTEHVLLGLIDVGGGVAAEVLKDLDVDLRKLRMEVDKLIQRGSDRAVTGTLPQASMFKKIIDWLASRNRIGRRALPQTPKVRKVIEYSMEEARNLKHNYVGSEHILLGLLREHQCVAAQMLMNVGLKLEKVREETLNLLGPKRN